MSKRIVCLILALILFVGLIPTAAITASAASNRNVTENAVKFIKDWEGYTKKAYADGTENGAQRYSYGYGTKAPSATATITEEDADKALREELKTINEKVNQFAAAHNKNFTQGQHDALVSFSYNVGWGWMSQLNYRITKAVLNGATGNDFLQAMCLWSNVDSLPVDGLVARRMAEADMYLNGSYKKNARESFTYVKFDANGGVLGEDKVQAYDYNSPVTISSVPKWDGHTFLGWYLSTGADATWVGVLNKDVAGKTLYARWQDDNATVEAGKVVGTPADYTISGLNFATNQVYAVPNSNNPSVETINQKDTFKVTAEFVDNNGEKWLKINSGWIKLGEIKVTTSTTNSSAVTVTVTNNFLNIRKEPNTDPTNAPIGSLNQGDKIVITATKEVKGALWGKHERGWSALMYTNYGTVSSGNSTSGNGNGAVIATGKVLVNATNLNVRTGAGTDHGIVGTLTRDTKVDIYEIVTVNGHGWGRIDAAKWVCLDYVNYTKVADTTVKEEISNGPVTADEPYKFKATVNADGLNIYSDPTNNVATPIGSLSKNDNVNILDMTAVNGIVFGRIITKNMAGWIQLDKTTYTASGVVSLAEAKELIVRKEASPSAEEVGKLVNGTAVTILEVKASGDVIMGRVKEGWINLGYVKLNTTKPAIITGSQVNSSTTTTTAKVIYTGTVNSGINLNVRLGAGVEYDICNSLANGTQVKVYEKAVVNGHYWGKLSENAWICLTYVTDTTNASGDTTTENTTNNGVVAVEEMATVVNCTTGVNIRSTPSVGGALLGSAPLNSRVKVLETTVYNGSKWARTEAGWISMLYLKLDSEVNYASNSTVSVNGLFSATVLTNTLDVYDAMPKSKDELGTVVATMNKGNSAYVSEVQSNNYKTVYGKVTVNDKTGWIDLSNTTFTARGQVKVTGTLTVYAADLTTDTTKRLSNGQSISIVEIKAADKPENSAETILWGKISLNEWVKLDYVNLVATSASTNSTGTAGLGKIAYIDTVNVRKTAGVKLDPNDIVTTLNRGTEVVIYEETVVDEAVWCRISTASVNGWVAKDYIDVIYAPSTGNNTVTTPDTNNTTTQPPVETSNYMTGIINTNNLKIRQEPDINSAIVDKLQSGMTVTIYEQKRGGSLDWGRVDKGWIALNYVTMTSTGSTGAGDMGTVIKAFSTVRVRAEATTESAEVGKLMVGSRVEVLDQKFVNGYTWYRVYNGWVHGDYIELDAPFVGHPSTTPTNPENNAPVTGPQDEVGGMYTTAILQPRVNDVVYFKDDNMVDNGTKLVKGETVIITALKGFGLDVYAKTKHGWFNLTNDSINFVAVGKASTVNDNYLKVRSEAGKTSTAPVDQIRDDAAVTLTGVVVANNNELWGKVAKGWVNLSEVELTCAKNFEHSLPNNYQPDVITPANPAHILFSAAPKADHLSITVYETVDGSRYGVLPGGTNFNIKEVRASGTTVWAAIEGKDQDDTEIKTLWVKLSDCTYTVESYIAYDCIATTSAGGSATGGAQMRATNSVKVHNLTAVAGEIYAQIITPDANKDLWLNIKQLTKWTAIPTIEEALSYDCIFTGKINKSMVYLYNQVDGNVVAALNNATANVCIKSITASGSAVWGKIVVKAASGNVDRWIKLSDLTYSHTGRIGAECSAVNAAGSTTAMGTAFKANDTVTVNNLTGVNGVIYAQITSDTNKGGWLKTTEITPWYVAPKVEEKAIASTSRIFTGTLKVDGAYFYEDATTAKSTGSMTKGTEVSVKSVVVSGGELWAEIHVQRTDLDKTTTNITRWTKLSYLNASISVVAKAKEAVYMLKGTSYDSFGSDPYKTVAANESVTITNFVKAGDGTLWAKVAHTVDGAPVDAYIQAQYLQY